MDINYVADEIRTMGADGSSLKISHDGIDFVAFKCPELIAQLKNKDRGHITIIGRSQLNEWMGRKSVQIIIDDIEIFDAENAAAAVSILDLI